LPEALAGLAHDLGRLPVDQFHGGQAHGRLVVVGGDAIDGGPIEIAPQLVVTTDQASDGIAHGGENSAHLAGT
jgi:hypothetical protein